MPLFRPSSQTGRRTGARIAVAVHKKLVIAIVEKAAAWHRTPAAIFVMLILAASWSFALSLFPLPGALQVATNTATNVVTFLLIVLMRRSQARDVETLQRQIDDLARPQALPAEKRPYPGEEPCRGALLPMARNFYRHVYAQENLRARPDATERAG